MQKTAVRNLNISYAEACDRTIFELTLELEGYYGRWEEHWRPFRKLGALIFNIHAAAEDRIEEYQYFTFPSERERIEFDDYVNALKFAKSSEQDIF